MQRTLSSTAGEQSPPKASDIADNKARGQAIVADLNKCASKKSFMAMIATFGRTMDKADRESKLTAAQATVRTQMAVPPIVTITLGILKNKGPVNKSTSIFEAKSGHRAACVLPQRTSDPAAELLKNTRAKKALKDLQQHLKVHLSGSVPITDKPTASKIKKELTKAYDMSLFSSIVLPSDQEWTSKAYTFQFFGQQPG